MPTPNLPHPHDIGGLPEPPLSVGPPRGEGRLRRYWKKHRTLFWTLHSIWALTTGVIVILLAREQYGFVPWVILFLGLTWLTTLYFARKVATDPLRVAGTEAPGVAEEATSYVTRTMYQETLFFLLPFYAYSTVIDSANIVFMVLLGGLAILCCLDLVFDRWLRSSRIGSLLFFAVVAFAGVNLLIPILIPMDPVIATRIAAGVAIATALPLALHGARPSRRGAALLALAVVLFLAVTIGVPRLVPPVPLRVVGAEFASNIDRASLELIGTRSGSVSRAELTDGLYVRMQVFAPGKVPTQVALRWERNGEPIRTSRTIGITAHKQGFRVWDAWRPDQGIEPGEYEVILQARETRVFGSVTIEVTP